MGIIPSQPVFGDDFLFCYPPGKTPKNLKCFFAGIKAGLLWDPADPPPPNGYWDLVQDPGDSSLWEEKPGSSVRIELTFPGGLSLLSCTVPAVAPAFGDITGVPCANHFTNEALFPGGRHYYGGTAVISTPAKLAEYVESITPMIDPDPRLECWPMEDKLIVVRYAGKRDATKFYMKIDTNP